MSGPSRAALVPILAFLVMGAADRTASDLSCALAGDGACSEVTIDPGARARADKAIEEFLHPKTTNRREDGCRDISARSLAAMGKMQASDGRVVTIIGAFNLHPIVVGIGDPTKLWGCRGTASILDQRTGATSLVDISIYSEGSQGLNIMFSQW